MQSAIPGPGYGRPSLTGPCDELYPGALCDELYLGETGLLPLADPTNSSPLRYGLALYTMTIG
jgi:hypothetical protein